VIEAIEFGCPWCGEVNEILAEPGDAGQWVVQDCRVCCCPIEIRLPDQEASGLEVRQEEN